MSCVVTGCSSTAAAIAVWCSLIRPMTWVICAMAAMAWRVSFWIASTRLAMPSVARAVP